MVLAGSQIVVVGVYNIRGMIYCKRGKDGVASDVVTFGGLLYRWSGTAVTQMFTRYKHRRTKTYEVRQVAEMVKNFYLEIQLVWFGVAKDVLLPDRDILDE